MIQKSSLRPMLRTSAFAVKSLSMKPMRRKVLFVLTSLFFYSSIHAQQLVLPGDYPDPSVVKIGDAYWASATTSNWFPAYPILYSTDLINWKQKGYVFNEL